MAGRERDELDVEKENKRIKAAFRRCFGDDAGEIVLQHLKDCYVFSSSHVKGDPHESAYKSGKRDLVLEIMSLTEER